MDERATSFNQKIPAIRSPAGALVEVTIRAENAVGLDRLFTLAPAGAISSGGGSTGDDEQAKNSGTSRIGARANSFDSNRQKTNKP